jgi:hypothetical protein
MTNNTTSIQARIAKAASAVGLVCGLGLATLAHGAGTASAPEPAKVTTSLNGPTGYSTAAVFLYSNTPTTVVLWSSGSTYVYSPTGPATGTPCSPFKLTAGATTPSVIQATTVGGGQVYRRCV